MESYRKKYTGAVIVLAILASCMVTAETRHWNPRRGYAPFCTPDSGKLRIENPGATQLRRLAPLPVPSAEFTVSFRAANLHNNPSSRYSYRESDGTTHRVSSPGWGICAVSIEGEILRVALHSEESADHIAGGGDGLSSRRRVRIRAYNGYGATSAPIAETTISEDFDLNSGSNSLRLTRERDHWILYGGNRKMQPLLSFDHPAGITREFGFEVSPGGSLEISYITCTTPDTPVETESIDSRDLRELREKAAESNDEMEGEWVVFDRVLEESQVKMGGDYRLLMLSEGEDYKLIYLEGAVTNSEFWNPGMLKCKLRHTPIPGVWNATWYDSEGEPLSADVRAQYDPSTTLLTITLPYSSSSRLRLYPIR